MSSLKVIKIGGKVIDDKEKLDRFLDDLAKIEGLKILVHGGGKLASDLAEEMGVEVKMLNGRRITDEATLRIATMVYGGLVNKQIVASLQKRDCNAVGLTGADMNIITSTIRPKDPVDFGYVGDIQEVNQEALKALLIQGITPVIAPLTHDGDGQLLNTNADNMASFIASAFSHENEVELIYCFDQQGVMDNGKVISTLNRNQYKAFRANGTITEGMIPKVDLAFKATENGVSKVIITGFELVLNPEKGTKIISDE